MTVNRYRLGYLGESVGLAKLIFIHPPCIKIDILEIDFYTNVHRH